MDTHITQLGYVIKETIHGLDVYDGGEFVCELTGARMADFIYNGKVNDNKLENAIEEELECEEFLDNMGGMYY